MKIRKSIFATLLTSLLSVACIFGSACGGNSGSDDGGGNVDYGGVSVPDYSSTNYRFDFFAYVAPTDGSYSADGTTLSVGEDFRTEERYREYKEAGFNMIMLRYENAYGGEPWDKSNTKKCMTAAYAAGLDRILVTDTRFDSMIAGGRLLGEGGTYPSEEELDKVVADCIAPYKDAQGFYGICLKDEPVFEMLENYGAVYKSLKRLLPNAFIHCNLLPMSKSHVTKGSYGPADEDSDEREVYMGYLREFFKHSGADRLSSDVYPFTADGTSDIPFYGTMQMMQKVCKEYNAKMSFCMQSTYIYNGTASKITYRTVDKSAMILQMNSVMGFGYDTMIYYTYFTHQFANTSGEMMLDGGSFINRDGTRTNIYYYGREVMSTAQSFANVILNYDYRGAALYTKTPANFDTTLQTAYFVNDGFDLIKGVETDNDIALVTELYNQPNDSYMYMVQNVIDPRYSEKSNTDNAISVDFGNEYEYVAEYDCGNLRYVKLNDGVYTKKLSAGYAVYLIPLK